MLRGPRADGEFRYGDHSADVHGLGSAGGGVHQAHSLLGRNRDELWRLFVADFCTGKQNEKPTVATDVAAGALEVLTSAVSRKGIIIKRRKAARVNGCRKLRALRESCIHGLAGRRSLAILSVVLVRHLTAKFLPILLFQSPSDIIKHQLITYTIHFLRFLPFFPFFFFFVANTLWKRSSSILG